MAYEPGSIIRSSVLLRQNIPFLFKKKLAFTKQQKFPILFQLEKRIFVKITRDWHIQNTSLAYITNALDQSHVQQRHHHKILKDIIYFFKGHTPTFITCLPIFMLQEPQRKHPQIVALRGMVKFIMCASGALCPKTQRNHLCTQNS